MHHLHPRSRSTSTLFTTTLAVSFLVVALPHLLPCPVDRRQFADTLEQADGSTQRRRRFKSNENEVEGLEGKEVRDAEASALTRSKERMLTRECPVPKPGGLVGQILGFEQKVRERPVEVVVVSRVPARRVRKEDTGNDVEKP